MCKVDSRRDRGEREVNSVGKVVTKERTDKYAGGEVGLSTRQSTVIFVSLVLHRESNRGLAPPRE